MAAAAEHRRPLVVRVGKRVLHVLERAIAAFSKVATTPFLPAEQFPWHRDLEARWPAIRAELDAVLAHKAAIPNFYEVSESQYQLTDDDDWKTFFLYGFGVKSEANCARCPETARGVEAIPGMLTAMFSILEPRKHIPAHRGPYKGVVRYHLGLIVPADAEACRIRVGDEVRHWREGEGLFFDDSFEHEVWNETDAQRVVLFVDVVRPMRFPFGLLNRAVLAAIRVSPFIRDYARRQRAMERRFADAAG